MLAFSAAERRRTLTTALLFTAATIVFAYPLSFRPSNQVLSDSPDTHLFLWTLAWDVHALTHQPLRLFDANIYYPLRHTLAYSEHLIGSAIVAAPILWLTDNPVLAMNIVGLLSVVLCGVGAYVLGRELGLSVPAAIVTGLVFAFSPPRFLRLPQLHLTTIQWVPFGLASLHAYLDRGRPFDLKMTIAFFTLQAMTSGHGAVFLGLGLALLVVRRRVVRPLCVLARDVGITGALLLAPTVLVTMPYLIVQREAGLRRALENWTVTPSSFLASPAHVHRWLLSWFPNARINETADAYLFPGVLPIVLAMYALMAAGTQRAVAMYALITGVSVWLTLGPPLGLWPLVYWLPGLNFIRVPSRFILLAVLGLAVLAGFGFERLRDLSRNHRDTEAQRWNAKAAEPAKSQHRSVRPPACIAGRLAWVDRTRERMRRVSGMIRSRVRLHPRASLRDAVEPSRSVSSVPLWLNSWIHASDAFAVLVCILLLAEFAAMPLHVDPFRVDIPAIDRWLAGRPKPFVVAEVPLPNPNYRGAFERRQTAFMLHSMAHWQKTVHGYSGVRLPLHVDLYNQLTRFPDEPSLAALTRLGVTYVVVHADWYSPAERTEIDRRLMHFSGRLRLEQAIEGGRVYALVSE